MFHYSYTTTQSKKSLMVLSFSGCLAAQAFTAPSLRCLLASKVEDKRIQP